MVNLNVGKTVSYYVNKSELSLNEIGLYSGLGGSTKLKKVMTGEATITIPKLFDFCKAMNITPVQFFEKMEEF